MGCWGMLGLLWSILGSGRLMLRRGCCRFSLMMLWVHDVGTSCAIGYLVSTCYGYGILQYNQ